MHFVDSNVWLYGIIQGDDVAKHDLAERLIGEIERPVVSTQVINEVCANAVRKARYDHRQVAELVAAFFESCLVIPVSEASMLRANDLRQRYSLSFWDSQLIACALLAGCSTFESEDLDHGLVVESALTIRNPFKF
jgi:predicted nucleic acid-binding protein